MRFLGASFPVLALVVMAGCSGDPHLMNIRTGQNTPDEFAVLPTKPLQMPPDLAALPMPEPGAPNITDPTPMADAVASLGGNPSRLSAQGIGASDGALVNYASRDGRQSNIRGQLAVEDLAFREGHMRRPLEQVFGTNVYYRAYEGMSLDQYAELERWRRAGARTPSAPPSPEQAENARVVVPQETGPKLTGD